MQKRTIGEAASKTEPDDNIGSRALDMLKEKMKLFELEKIPQLSSSKKKISSKYRNKGQEYQIHSSCKQPQSYSQYRISSKEQKQISNKKGMYSQQTLRSVKTRLSLQDLQEAQLLNVPVIKISRERILSENETSQNNISLILMEKYYQSTIKYEERKKKLNQQQEERNNSSNVMSRITITNQAVKNYKRRLKHSRKEQMELINKTHLEPVNKILSDIIAEGNIQHNPPRPKFRPQRAIFYRRNLSSI